MKTKLGMRKITAVERNLPVVPIVILVGALRILGSYPFRKATCEGLARSLRSFLDLVKHSGSPVFHVRQHKTAMKLVEVKFVFPRFL
jgi:hypothetical protein